MVSPKTLLGATSLFGRFVPPTPNRRQKIAILISLIPIGFYDWAIGSEIDPIMRLIVAIVLTWYSVLVILLQSYLYRRVFPWKWETNLMASLLAAMLNFLIAILKFITANYIATWILERLMVNGYLSGLTLVVTVLLAPFCLWVLPIIWFGRSKPPSQSA